MRKNKLSVKKAAAKNNIPRSNLQDRINDRVPENKQRSGPNPFLTTQEESVLTNWCLDLAKCGFPVKYDELVTSVKILLDKTKRITSFPKNKPGRTWLRSFYKRNPVLAKKQAKSISKGRAVVTEESIRKWFRDLENYLIEIGHRDVLDDPKRILNKDEKMILIDIL